MPYTVYLYIDVFEVSLSKLWIGVTFGFRGEMEWVSNGPYLFVVLVAGCAFDRSVCFLTNRCDTHVTWGVTFEIRDEKLALALMFDALKIFLSTEEFSQSMIRLLLLLVSPWLCSSFAGMSSPTHHPFCDLPGDPSLTLVSST
jgi:hypothetical protein